MTAIDYDALLADYGQAMYDEGCYEAAHNHVLAKEARSRASSELAQLYAAIRALRAALAESERDAVTTEMCAAVRLALHRAYGLGQTYFQQADSESYTQNKNADKTASKFKALADSVEDLLLSNSATRLAAMAAQEKANG